MKRTPTAHQGVYSYTTSRGETRYCIRVRGSERTGFHKLADAKVARARLMAEDASSTISPQLARQTLLRDVWPGYLAARSVRAPRGTITQAERHWRHRIEPALGHLSLSRVTLPVLEKWLQGMAAEGLSASYIINVVGTLPGVLKHAVKYKLLASNPCTGLELPTKEPCKDERRFLSAEDVARVAEHLSGQPRAAFLTLVFTGLRWGELRGLRVSDLDVVSRRLTVKRSVSYLPSKKGEWEWHENATKTNQTRRVAIAPQLLPLLVEQASGKKRSDLLFPSADGGYWREPANASKGHRMEWLERALKAADIDYLSPHELRHTAASLLVSGGANILAAARMLGHSPSMMMEVYADLYEKHLDAAAEALGKSFPE